MNTEMRQTPRRRAAWLAALCAVLAAPLAPPLAQAAAGYDHHVRQTPANAVIGNFPAQKQPILTVKSGETVRIDGGGGNRWGDEDPQTWLKDNGLYLNAEQRTAIEEIARVVKQTPRQPGIPGGHLLVGPIAIEGAMPGDTLEVQILSVEPRIPYGVVSMRPGRGGIPDEVPAPYAKLIPLDLKRKLGRFDPGIEVPLGPFNGVMGVLPAASEGSNRRSGPPGLFGGNLDCKELVAGTRLFLPVFRRGALFFTGDSHAAQGDGEVTVTAIETANTVVFRFVLHKGMRLSAPRAETPTHWITFGLDPDLDKAMQMAIRETNAFLKEKKGLEFERAFALSSIGIDFRVTQVVDDVKGVHAMIPKALFVDDKPRPIRSGRP
ncbi:acetamidase/formamidase family protein [Solimonas flava]|uniref:acetamidase/formamidase family protein n=1 Tax=Solimonas flava TaxID=415849 RepID=UPI0004885823|nr:acetamidase/formamidase family protein [Solimonas flava]